MTLNGQISLLAKVEDSFLALGLGFDDPLVIMVSGGSDSVALLLLTRELCLSAGGSVDNLLVLHVNHQLRGAEALADERFVVKLCEDLEVNCQVERRDVAALASETGVGVEQAGRTIRYALAEEARVALAEQADKETEAFCPDQNNTSRPLCPAILTAHTADDRAETLLQRLIVGGGGSSLASIPKQNGCIVRPLLECTRQELRDWLTEQNIHVDGSLWCEDATNLDTSHSRAFVRHELLPLIEKRNPRIIEGLNRTAEILTSEDAWMLEQAVPLLPLTQDSFSAPLPLLRRAVYLACNQAISELAPEARVTFEHVELIVQKGNIPGFACQIPGGIEVRNVQGQLVFKKAKPPKHNPKALKMGA